MDYYGWTPYISVAARRRRAERERARLGKKEKETSPVVIDGRRIARTFWGKAWCGNLERYSDFENRLPRGRTYVRNGSVIDLRIAPGKVAARVVGSDIYDIQITVASVSRRRWRAICQDCTGAIDSVVELLQGRLSESVMTRICEEKTGLFPAPKEIAFTCSCPDWAFMCKHVAATLYGIGARLDERPELLFLLRRVNQEDLIATAGNGLRPAGKAPATGRILDTGDLSEVFGIEMAQAVRPPTPASRRKPASRVKAARPKAAKRAAKKPAAKAAGHGPPSRRPSPSG